MFEEGFVLSIEHSLLNRTAWSLEGKITQGCRFVHLCCAVSLAFLTHPFFFPHCILTLEILWLKRRAFGTSN